VSILHARITSQGRQAAASGYHPYGTAATPMTMPLALVKISTGGMTYDTVQPLWTADGAAVPATADGAWGQLYAAGHP
jgi:hypothetical protein